MPSRGNRPHGTSSSQKKPNFGLTRRDDDYFDDEVEIDRKEFKRRDEDTFEDSPIHPRVDIHHGIDEKQKDSDEEEYIIRLLARRSMHLPNMNWCQDWCQYMKNNHPLLGIFFHHPLHPLDVANRLYLLMASAAFGLAATNCVYLYYAFTDDEMDKVLVEIVLDDSPVKFREIEALQITYGMVSLWTFGGILHSLFDICMWYISACACFLTGSQCSKRGKLKVVGSYIVIAIGSVLVALALFVVFMRAAYDRRLRLAQEGIVLEDFQWKELGRIRNFSFLIGYLVELGLTYFAYYPLLITCMIIGVAPCVSRNRELKKQRRERSAREQRYRKQQEKVADCERIPPKAR